MIDGKKIDVEMILQDKEGGGVIALFFICINGVPWGDTFSNFDTAKGTMEALDSMPTRGFARETWSVKLWDNSVADFFEFISAPQGMFLVKHHNEWSYYHSVEEIEMKLCLRRKQMARSDLNLADWIEFENDRKAKKIKEEKKHSAKILAIKKEMLEKGLVVPARFSHLTKPCWIPVLSTTLKPDHISRYGGKRALARLQEGWPMHKDRLPMQLISQFDNDSLHKDMAVRLGGCGKIFQLFVPMGCSRSLPTTAEEWSNREYPFEVRFLDKQDKLIWINEPDVTPRDSMPQAGTKDQYRIEWEEDYGGFPEQQVQEWRREVDLPFSLQNALKGRGKRATQAELEICENSNFREDKLGGCPSLEQGPVAPDDWDYLLQVAGGGICGDQVAFDGAGWLLKSPQGEFKLVTVSD